ncbi:MAG: FAD-binding oxidoreductase [Acidobacteriota bacterium]
MAHRPSEQRQAKRRRVEEWQQKENAYFERLGINRDRLSQMELQIVGKIVLPGDPGYDTDRQESNPAFQAYPIMIVYCAVENDVWICLETAAAISLPFCIRSGGHSTAGYSVVEGGILIDVSLLSYVSIDAANSMVTVGPGTNFDTLNGALNSTNLHVPSGECGDVCVGGFVQGGGYGYTSRCFGVQSDCVLAFRVMLANGGIVFANATTNSDLYWAMRGGTGGNFGVVLSVIYQLFVVPSVWAYSIQWDIDDAAAALLEMQTNYMLTGVKELGATTNLGFNGSTPVLLMQGMYVGSAATGKQALSSLLSLGSADLNVDISGKYGAMDAYLETHPYSIPNPPDGSKEDKLAGYIEKPLALADWQAIVNYELTAPNPNNTAIIEPYGGAINAFPVSGSAFVHRKAAMDFFVDVFWVDDADRQQAVGWLNGFWKLMQPYLNGHVYQNYPNRGLADFENAYWGSAYPRLTQVKAKYDPQNVFQFQQSIRVGGQASPGPIVYEQPPPSA